MKTGIIRTSRLLQKNLLWLLVLVYTLGAIWPDAGLWIRGTPGESSGWLLKPMLALLLLNAGLGCETRNLRRLSKRGHLLVTALGAALGLPWLYVLGTAAIARIWMPVGQIDQLVLGLAVVAAMPVAASSTAWTQNAEGNLALSLGLLLISTLFGPLTASLLLRTTAGVIRSQPNAASLVSATTAMFLTLWVALPVACGVILRRIIGSSRIERARPHIKLVNIVILLILNYANASLALPSVVKNPEPFMLTFVTVTTLGMAGVAFGSALLVIRLHRVTPAQRTALLFGMGMKNNGAGLVLVATGMTQPGPVLLPIIFYNLAQHLGAAMVSRSEALQASANRNGRSAMSQ